MEIKFNEKMNNRVRIEFQESDITRTIEDFEILEENLLLNANTLLIPQVPKKKEKNYQEWFKTLCEYNENVRNNEIVSNFLKNKEYYLNKNNNTLLKMVTPYLEKMDQLWTQSSEHHKWVNKHRKPDWLQLWGNTQLIRETIQWVL